MWLISCSIVTDQYLKGMFFGSVQVVEAGRQASLSKTFNVLDILYYLVSIYRPPLLSPEKIFRIKVLKWLENTILRCVFANTVDASCNYTLFQLLYLILTM